MPAWSALLVQKIDLRVRGLVVRKLQVNRHRVAEVAPHAHGFAQVILYLSGTGTQMVGPRAHAAREGELFVIPPHQRHGFAPHGRARPICLVLDFDRGDGEGRSGHRRLEPAALNRLHELVSRLPRKGGLRWHDYATVIAVVALLFESPAAPAPVDPAALPEPAFARVRRWLQDADNAARPLSDLAHEAGCHVDHLTRKLRRECGQGLRAMRDSLRLETAVAALRAGASVADAAQRAGFNDPAYFARWFRRRQGEPPRDFRRRGRP